MTESTIVWDEVVSGSREVALLVDDGWSIQACTMYYSERDDDVMLVSMLTRKAEKENDMTPERLKDLLKDVAKRESIVEFALDYIEYLERSSCDCCRTCDKGKE